MNAGILHFSTTFDIQRSIFDTRTLGVWIDFSFSFGISSSFIMWTRAQWQSSCEYFHFVISENTKNTVCDIFVEMMLSSSCAQHTPAYLLKRKRTRKNQIKIRTESIRFVPLNKERKIKNWTLWKRVNVRAMGPDKWHRNFFSLRRSSPGEWNHYLVLLVAT